MSDVDTRLLEILEPDLAERVQSIVDTMVEEETRDLDEEIAKHQEKVIKLTGLLRVQRHREDLLRRSLADQAGYARHGADFLYSALNSKNLLTRIAARGARWNKAVDQYSRLKQETVNEVLAENAFQDTKWGPARQMPNGTGRQYSSELADYYKEETNRAFAEGTGTWRHILEEEFYEAMAETNPKRLIAELLQVAAVCVAWIVSLKLQRPKK